ncbi:MAG: class I SAM-dependent methyltransferase [Acidobacteriota bacterium]
MSDLPFVFACPICHRPLEVATASRLVDFQPTAAVSAAFYCAHDNKLYAYEDGIWRFLTPEHCDYFSAFVAQYEAVRRVEGWGADSATYYRSLPFADSADRFSRIWRIRAQSFRTLVGDVVRPHAAARRRPLKILDLGAGNCWLSYRLTQEGHHLAAVDILTNRFDGLGAAVWYEPEVALLRAQAAFDRLPFAAEQADLVVFNGSFHYSIDYAVTLEEALRVLRADGRLIIMDTPLYDQPRSGARMVSEREEELQRRFGFSSSALPHESYLTLGRLRDLAAHSEVHWQLIKSSDGWRRTLRAWKARLLGRRQPATFDLIVITPPSQISHHGSSPEHLGR